MLRTGLVRRALVILTAATLALVLRPSGPVPVLAVDTIVHIAEGLDPSQLRITPGTTVTWFNDDQDRHRVRTTSGPTEFDSGDLDPGETFSVTFTGAGTWQYRDDRNPDLSNYWGSVIVAPDPTPTPRPTPTPPPGSTPAPATPRPPTPPPPPPPGDILMAGRAFSPATVTVDAGTTVRWRNNDSRDHTVTANDNAFDSGIMRVGATFTKVFNTPGTFRYLCQLHPDMTGTIAVRSGSGATPPPPPPPTPTPKPTPVPTSPPANGNEVNVVDFAFDPKTIDVAAGTTITWVNAGAALHTVTATDGTFDSGLMGARTGRYSRRFSTPGTFPYLCSLHPSMTGTVRVSGADGATPPPPPKPTPKPTSPPVAAGQLELRDFSFVPSTIRITPGTRITWVNTGVAPHTVTDRAGAFDSGIMNRGDTYARLFPAPGTFQLVCAIHPDMHATVTVAAPGATAPPPSTPKPVPTPSPGSGEVAILDFSYAPVTVEVPVGTTVRWTNEGVAPHSVTAKDGAFDSGFLANGEAYTRTFSAEGVVEYFCSIHPAMVGTVVVGAGGGSGGAAGAGSTAPEPSAGSAAAPGAASGAPGSPGPAASASTRPGSGAGQAPPGEQTAQDAPFGPRANAAAIAAQTQLAVIAGLVVIAGVIFAVLLGVMTTSERRT